MKMVSNKLYLLNLLQTKLNQNQCHQRLYSLKHVFCRGVRFKLQGFLHIRHLHIYHNAPYLRPIIFVFHFSWILQPPQEKLKAMLMQIFFFGGGERAGKVNKVHYGICASGVLLQFCFRWRSLRIYSASLLAKCCGFLLPHPPIPQGWPVHVGIELDKSFPLDQVPV